MRKEFTTQQLTDTITSFLAVRGKGADPTKLNLHICPTLESCDGPSQSVVFRFFTYPWMSNPMGVTHGGMISAILDASMGILSTALYGVMTPTITMTTNYCRPVPLETEVLVTVRANYTGGTNIQLSCEMCLPDEPCDPLATASGVYYTAHANQ